MEGNFDALNDEYFTLGLYLPDRIGVEIIEGNLTRCQRAGKSAEQSATRRSDHIVEGRGVRLLHVRRDTVVLGNLAVDAEENRLLFGR
ncbi:MAG TPA: hypothetical protein VNA27_05800 [Rubrobacteraceae bacterium]|nr:hypothetical protein [Rubrobacteraceae bacterium]